MILGAHDGFAPSGKLLFKITRPRQTISLGEVVQYCHSQKKRQADGDAVVNVKGWGALFFAHFWLSVGRHYRRLFCFFRRPIPELMTVFVSLI